jgi:hypothetical protein
MIDIDENNLLNNKKENLHHKSNINLNSIVTSSIYRKRGRKASLNILNT